MAEVTETEEQKKLKYVPIYRSLYETIKEADMNDIEFRRAIITLLEYGFDNKEMDPNDERWEHNKETDRFFMSMYKANVPFIEKTRTAIERGSKGGRGNKKDHAKTMLKAETEKESETETERETENEREKEQSLSMSPPQKGGSISEEKLAELDAFIEKCNGEQR